MDHGRLHLHDEMILRLNGRVETEIAQSVKRSVMATIV